MKLFNQDFFAKLTQDAVQSDRLRANKNLHQSYEDSVQRLFIAMEPDSYVRPHRHIESNKWEFFFVVKGSLLFLLYDENGIVLQKITLTAGGDTQGLEIPPNTWHSTVALESGTVFFEVKEGPYTVTSDKGFARWAPEEGSHEVGAYIELLKAIELGQAAKLIN